MRRSHCSNFVELMKEIGILESDFGSWSEVWVEIEDDLFDPGNADRKDSSSAHISARDVLVQTINTRYVRGRCSKHALFVADLTRRSESAKNLALESALTSEEMDKLDSAVRGMIEEHSTMVPVYIDAFQQTVNVPISNIFQANDDGIAERTHDLTGLTFLEEPNILASLKQRFEKDLIYTSIAGIMVAINPYKSLPIYNKEMMRNYRRKGHVSTNPKIPHIYSVAEDSFTQLTAQFSKRFRDRPQNQSLIVCGESGSGKTENAKHIMHFLANRSKDVSTSPDQEVQGSLVETQVMDTNSVLEAFGNAATVLNHNSSRFGKFTKLYFRTSNIAVEESKISNSYDYDRVVGASTETYLLEKSRVVLQSKGERNFHIFYELFCGLSEHKKVDLGLNGLTARDFFYTREGVFDDIEKSSHSEMTDQKNFQDLVHGMQALGIDLIHQEQVFSVVAAVLHLGNITFESDHLQTEDACIVSLNSRKNLSHASRLLGIEELKLEKKLTTQRIKVMKESITRGFKPGEAKVSLDAISKTLYEGLFLWIVKQINLALEQDVNLPWIGILDVFGFEVFVTNSFEQFCINFANEKLQQHFNHAILISEQQEYARESIFWKPIDIQDGQETIDLIEKPWTGILSLLDSACKLSSTTSEYFVQSLFDTHKNNSLLYPVNVRNRGKTPRKRPSMRKDPKKVFLLKHYAGVVEYNADEFISKNKDKADPDSITLFQSSGVDVIKDIFTFENFTHRDSVKSNLVPKSSFVSVSKSFSSQLKELLKTLGETHAFFIRCIKPNLDVSPSIFDSHHVRPQLQCGGLVAVVKMLKYGYPTRVSYEEIFKQYTPLLTCDSQRTESLNRRHFCQAILSVFGLHTTDFQLGLTKVFFKAEKRHVLHMILNYEKKFSSQQMKSLFRFLALRQWKRVLSSVTCSVRIFRRIQRKRALDKFVHSSRILATYIRSFRRLHRRVVRRISAHKIQLHLHTLTAKLKIIRLVEERRQERIRAEEAETIRLRKIEKDSIEELQGARGKIRTSSIDTHTDGAPPTESLVLKKIPAPKFQQEGSMQVKLRGAQEDYVSAEEERICREVSRVSRIMTHEPSTLEVEVADWIESVLGIQVSNFLVHDLASGVILIQLLQKLNPRFCLKYEEPSSDESMTRNVQKAAKVLKAIGIPAEYIYSYEELMEACDGKLSDLPVLKCLSILQNRFTRIRRSSKFSNFERSKSSSITDSPPAVTSPTMEPFVASIASLEDENYVTAAIADSTANIDNVEFHEFSSKTDNERLLALVKENSQLKKQLEDCVQVISKLKETVTSLDKINRNIVEDLHMELQFRAETDAWKSHAVSQMDNGILQVSSALSDSSPVPSPEKRQGKYVESPPSKLEVELPSGSAMSPMTLAKNYSGSLPHGRTRDTENCSLM